MNRIVVLSDPSKEFPNNTPNAFKVRLPKVVRFDGEWEAALASISMPNEGMDLRSYLSSDEVISTKYHMKDSGTNPETITLKSSQVTKTALIQRNAVIVDGVGFMKEVVQELNRQMVLELIKAKMEYVDDSQRPTFRWEGETMILERKKVADVGSLSHGKMTFCIDIDLAQKMGWIEQRTVTALLSSVKIWVLGVNLDMDLHEKDQKRLYRQLVTELPKKSDWAPNYWEVKENKLWLSQTVEWRFLHLNHAFNRMSTQPSRTMLVYSDVVSSNIVGDSEHQLVREVHYTQDGTGVIYFEPTHIQWMPMRRAELDVIEVSVGESTGELARFAPGGRTIITFQFRKKTS